MATAHISAKVEDVAETVLMPGDPLRAKFIAENFLDDYKLINDIRGMYGYTGFYKGKKVTVMASGMGIPSMGIYSYELFRFYNVKNIIRLGTCGAYIKELNLYDIILTTGSYSETAYDDSMGGDNKSILYADKKLNKKIENKAKELNIKIIKGLIHSTEAFYKEDNIYEQIYKDYGCIAAEMESFALFYNAYILNKKAVCILTVANSLVTKEETTSEEREKHFVEMIKLALESI
ncbi:MAG: purine-nucleoside phosphorylase [Bacilli bacterium]